MEYHEYKLSVATKLFKYVDDSPCRCLPGTRECVCSSSITACHVHSAGFLFTINPRLDFPIFIDSGKSPCYWHLPHRGDSIAWTKLCGVTYGHSHVQLTLNEILVSAGDSDSFCFNFFL